MTTLTDEEAQKLFREVSQSIRNNESSQLDTLVTSPDTGISEEVETPIAEEQPQETETPEETPTSEDERKEQSPPTNEAEEVPESTETPAPDELATLKEQLAGLKKENHHLKSQAGRMPHMQSKVKELDKKLEELRTRLSSPSSQPSAKITPALEKVLAKLKDTDPELAEIIAAATTTATDGAHREQLAAEISSTEALRKAEYEAYHKSQWDELVESVPNAADIFKDKYWAEWKSQQSDLMQQLASSDTAADVVYAIQRYTADMVAKFPELQKKSEEVATPTPAPDAATAEKAKQVEAARQQKKQGSVVTDTPAAAGQVSTPSDAMSLFKKYSEEIRKERLGK